MDLIMLCIYLMTFRDTWIHWGDCKHTGEEEASPVCDRIGVPRPIRDCESMRSVQQACRATTQVLCRQSWLPERHGWCHVRCSQKVNGGEEPPHGSMEEEKLHADEMVKFFRATLYWMKPSLPSFVRLSCGQVHRSCFNLLAAPGNFVTADRWDNRQDPMAESPDGAPIFVFQGKIECQLRVNIECMNICKVLNSEQFDSQ